MIAILQQSQCNSIVLSVWLVGTGLKSKLSSQLQSFRKVPSTRRQFIVHETTIQDLMKYYNRTIII